MAVEIGSAYFTLIPSMSGTAAAVKSGLGTSAVSGAFASGGRAGGLAMGAGVAGGFTKALPLIGGAIAAVGIADFFGKATDAASNLNESANAVRVTFGDAAAAVENLGKTSATRLGLSQNDFNSIAVRFSSFANTIAGEGGNVVSTLDEITKRGSDFASVYNIDVDDALTLFQSGLAGESEPFRRFGVDISEATVKSTAYRLGIAKVGTQLTEQQKIQARYAAIMEQTSKVQGDFANTSDQLANKQRINSANLQDSLAKVGDALLPAAQAFAQWMGNEDNQKRLEHMVDAFLKLEPVISVVADVLVTILDIFATSADELSRWFDAFADGKVTLEEMIGIFKGMPDWMQSAMIGVTNFLSGIINNFLGAVNSVIAGVEGVINAVVTLTGGDKVHLGRLGLLRELTQFDFRTRLDTTTAVKLGLPGLATGGEVTGSGWSWVGEKGPELLNLPTGAQVVPLDQASSGREINIINPDPYVVLQMLKNELGGRLVGL